MKYLKIYEQYLEENPLKEISIGEVPLKSPRETIVEDPEESVHFETETTNFKSTPYNTEGNYIVYFKNSEGQDTTIEIAGAHNPEFIGNKMISAIEVIPDSASDGKTYSVVGYYEEIPNTSGQYELKKILIEEV